MYCNPMNDMRTQHHLLSFHRGFINIRRSVKLMFIHIDNVLLTPRQYTHSL